ncbi:MAG: potassium transporter TrkH, partial [Acidobacteria bacterium]|nr:potassium transporter TrkH [Acidobacteriota bacterium]
RRKTGRSHRLSIHTRLVLASTAALLLGGALLFAVFEWNRTLGGLSPADKLTNALFLSVTSRTAGFNTIDYSEAAQASSFLTVILMSIGGSPGSTAGGLKTTTVALVFLLAWHRFRGRRRTSLWHRTVPEETLQRAVGLFVFVAAVMTFAVFVFSVTELGLERPSEGTSAFLHHVFEVVSAFNTVGLSMGLTTDLSAAGRWLTILLMFLGRVGPLSFAAAIALPENRPGRSFRYAFEDVIVG